MKARLRQRIAILHQSIGLVIGILFAIVGLTGSLLVFGREIDQWLLSWEIGSILPKGQWLDPETILQVVKTAYANRPELKLDAIEFPRLPTLPYIVWLDADDRQFQVFLNPYTGKILSDRWRDQSFFGFLLVFHYSLMAGQIGMTLIGIVAFFVCLLSITGIVLWTGWKKLVNGFKIKWNGHYKRLNFDLHKVSGITAAMFLIVTAFTGFCWNFYDFTEPLIYAATSTPNHTEAVSTIIPNRPPLRPNAIWQKASLTLPEAMSTRIRIPSSPDGVFTVFKRLPEDHSSYSNSVEFDQYSGKIVQVRDRRSLPLGDRILHDFEVAHFGTFGGLPTRILYVFVGLSPTILLITGFIIRRPRKTSNSRLG